MKLLNNLQTTYLQIYLFRLKSKSGRAVAVLVKWALDGIKLCHITYFPACLTNIILHLDVISFDNHQKQ